MLPLLNGSRLASAQRRIAAQAILVGAWTLVWSMGNLLSAQGVTTFRAGVDLVPMRVSVATRDGQPVLDLTRDDFLVLDRGRPAEIGAFAKVAPTIAAQLLIDDCPRITPHEDAVRALARDFLGSIRGGDRAAIATYISRGTPFTDDLRLLAAGLDTAFRGHRPADCDTWYSWTGLDMARARSNGPLDRMFGPDGSLWHAPGYLEWSSGVSAEVRTIIVASSGMDYRGSDTERPEVAPAAT